MLPYPTKTFINFKFFSKQKAEKGEPGDKGKKGRNGKTGKRGERGLSIVGPKGEAGGYGIVDKDFSEYIVKIISSNDEEIINYCWAQLMCTNDCKVVENVKIKRYDDRVLLHLTITKSIETVFIVVDPSGDNMLYKEITSSYDRNEFDLLEDDVLPGTRIHITVRWS